MNTLVIQKFYQTGLLTLWGTATLGWPQLAAAQISPDATLETEASTVGNGVVEGTPVQLIEAGAVRGSNLFHSFSEFNVGSGEAVYFANPLGIENILSRVTGGNVSQIDGLLGVDGSANLFLLNPNGIIFSDGAALDVEGSFLATTAASVLFGDGLEFSAADTTSTPLLTVSVPTGLRLGDDPGAIAVTGPGHNLELDFTTFTPIRDNRPVGLQVNSGQTLALIGGDISIEGGNLTANQGRVELGSVAQAGTVALVPTADGFTTDYGDIDRFGEITFTEAASVEISGEGSGNLNLQGGNLAILDDSVIMSNVLGADDGGEVRIRVTDLVDIRGSEFGELPTGFFNQGEANSTGQVGGMVFDVGTLRLIDGGQINGLIVGQGDGGSIDIQADDIELNETSPVVRFSSGIVTFTAFGSEGNAGSIDLTVDTLQVSERAVITTRTSGRGNGGPLSIQANDLISVTGGGQINSGTSSQGNGGNLAIQAGTVKVSGAYQDTFFVSGISTTASPGSQGSPGNIELNVDVLEVSDLALVTNAISGQEDGGLLSIQASSLIRLTGGLRLVAAHLVKVIAATLRFNLQV